MKKDMKKASPVTFDDLKTLIKETAEALGGSLSQDNLDAFLTQYDLDDNAAEELLHKLGMASDEEVDPSIQKEWEAFK